MVGKLAATSLAVASAIDLTWSDCGDASTHAVVKDLQPTTINLGKNSLKGSGTLDEDIEGGTFNFVAKAGPVPVLKGSGNLCEDTTINLPLGAGSVVFNNAGCPLKAGDIDLSIDVNVLSSEAVNDLVKISITAEATNGDHLLCLDLGVASAESEPTLGAPMPAGPYKVSYKTYKYASMDKTDKTIDVWYPEGAADQKFPLVSYSHGNTAGGSGLKGDYDALLRTMAAYGYIIAAHESCNTGCSDIASLPLDPPGFKNMYKEQLKVIDWAKDQSAAGDSVFKSLNVEIGVGVSGHSMGGQATMFAAAAEGAGHGVKAAAMHHAWSVATFVPPVVPFLAFTGTGDTIAIPSMTESFFNKKGANPVKGLVNKVGATHFEPNDCAFEGCQLGRYSAAWFKIFLDETPQADGNDYHDLIFGTGESSLCHGGDGAMSTCDIRNGGPAPTPTPPAPSPTPSPTPESFTCDQCVDRGYAEDGCSCGVCGSFGLCTFSCSPGAGRVACDSSVAV